MNTIFGMIAAIIVAIGLSFVIGPYAGIVILAAIFGLVFSVNQRNKEIYDDLQKIKEKLGIAGIDEFNMNNEDIERELEEAHLKDNQSSKVDDIDK